MMLGTMEVESSAIEVPVGMLLCNCKSVSSCFVTAVAAYFFIKINFYLVGVKSPN